MEADNVLQISAEDRKLILIVEDEFINREMLRMSISKEYDLLLAENGSQALKHIDESGDRISLMLLDLNLPDMNGLEILKHIHERGAEDRIPVIVLTADVDAEVESLDIGAADFIPKPYPRPEVINARIRRTIELSEKRVIIDETEHDALTGLYNREFFYLYAHQLDMRNTDAEMDAIVIDINHFHMINERYGREYSDEVLKRIGANIRALVDMYGGIGCRRDADHFLAYFPHHDDYETVFRAVADGASGEGSSESIVRLRMGVYPNVDKDLDVERRFDRAKLAADTAKSKFDLAVATYDRELNEKNMFNEQLIVAFPEAIRKKQFKVYFQPKFDITGEVPVLCSAEALVRWAHPEFGFINPGVFIETLEKNGLISRLDNYVWDTTAKQIKAWRDKLGVTIPVSVNVSRADLFAPDVCDTVYKIVEGSGITNSELILEVTESAYAENSEHITRTVDELRGSGFMVEMDDFGSGYSSLNMITSLPIDALKLDMQFIRSAFRDGGDMGLIGIVIKIAELLDVPVIAEGVETEEQMLALKELGCDIVQGYYFSKPVPPEEFERFLIEKKDAIN